jgi:hypothetical protein
MACEGGPSYQDIEAAEDERRLAVAALCGILSSVPDPKSILKKVDWEEAGISMWGVLNWWHGHQKKDRQRRKAEQEQKEKDELRKTALSKLTKQERKALGL